MSRSQQEKTCGRIFLRNNIKNTIFVFVHQYTYGVKKKQLLKILSIYGFIRSKYTLTNQNAFLKLKSVKSTSHGFISIHHNFMWCYARNWKWLNLIYVVRTNLVKVHNYGVNKYSVILTIPNDTVLQNTRNHLR